MAFHAVPCLLKVLRDLLWDWGWVRN